MAPALSSAKGVLSLLHEQDDAVITFALRRLSELMDTFWYEISAELPIIEELHNSTAIGEKTRAMAALIASEVYFHLGEYDESVQFALAAGSAFDSMPRSLFTDIILSRCIDQYVQYQEAPHDTRGALDPRLEALFLSLTKSWIVQNDSMTEMKEMVGFTIRARRLDFLENVLRQAVTKTNSSSILSFTFYVANVLLRDITFRREVLRLLARLYGDAMVAVDYFALAQCLVFLDDVPGTASLIMRLLREQKKTVVFQIAFDLFQYSGQNFLSALRAELERVSGAAVGQASPLLSHQQYRHEQDDEQPAGTNHSLVESSSGATVAGEARSDEGSSASSHIPMGEVDESQTVSRRPAVAAVDESASAATTVATAAPSTDDEAGATNTHATPPASTNAVAHRTSAAPPLADPTVAKVISVLTGEVTTSLYLKFLYARCAADIHLLNQIKRQIDPRKFIVHNATVMANAFMYCGTTIDGFLRDNMTWMTKANYWAKFTAIGSIGVIHRGHVDEAMKIMQPYLPSGGSLPSLPYQQAGALYALGLIDAPLGSLRDRTTVNYLKEALQKYAPNAQMTHGASLGLGLAAMGLHDEDLYDLLYTSIPGGDAVGGEGAAVGIGMLMMGSGNAAVADVLLNTAQEDNQKEKIIRGTSMALALMSLGRENEAMELANRLLESADPWIRLGGCFVLGLAFAGTESTVAIERLLYVAVKDTSDDVRRNAVMMIGFLTFKDPALCLELTKTLVDSYNPHIRYGVAMALAVSGSGTGRSDFVDLLWEMTEDLVNYVRQGAYLALALVMTQLTERENGKVKMLRALLGKKIRDSKEDVCTKFGCILASGLLDMGGRNCVCMLHRDRHRLDKAVVGMFMFTQYWYWFPYALMISLAVQPTCFIGLNDELEMPEYTFQSNVPASYYAVPKSVLLEKKEIKAAGVQAVVLSTTRKEEELRQRRKRANVIGAEETATSSNNKNNTSSNAPGSGAAGEGGASSGVAGGGVATGKKDAEPEAETEVLHNPARVTAHQFSHITHNIDRRYVPLKENAMGVCLLEDTKPDLGMQKLIDAIVITDKEAPVPKPFAYP